MVLSLLILGFAVLLLLTVFLLLILGLTAFSIIILGSIVLLFFKYLLRIDLLTKECLILE